MITKREGCRDFSPKLHPEQTGDCQTDGHYMCGECKHIASAVELDESDNVMRYYPHIWRQEREYEKAKTLKEMSWNNVNKSLRKAAEKSGTFDLWQFDANEVGDKILVAIDLFDTGDGWELQLVFEDGKQIEICMTEDNCIHIQTD